jgi:hypothetical protein
MDMASSERVGVTKTNTIMPPLVVKTILLLASSKEEKEKKTPTQAFFKKNITLTKNKTFQVRVL